MALASSDLPEILGSCDPQSMAARKIDLQCARCQTVASTRHTPCFAYLDG